MKDKIQDFWNIFFEEKEKFDVTKYDKSIHTLRLPSNLQKQIIKDLRLLEDEGVKTNFNEYVVMALMILSNSTINDKGEFSSKRNGKGLANYLKQAKEEEKRGNGKVDNRNNKDNG